MLASWEEYKQTEECQHFIIDGVPNRVMHFGGFLEEMERRISAAYLAGYKDGRTSAKIDGKK